MFIIIIIILHKAILCMANSLVIIILYRTSNIAKKYNTLNTRMNQVLQYFANISHNLAALNGFAAVMRLTNHTEL